MGSHLRLGFLVIFALGALSCKKRSTETETKSVGAIKDNLVETRADEPRFDNVQLIPDPNELLVDEEAELDPKFEEYEKNQSHERKVHSILVDLSTQMLAQAKGGNPHGKASRDAHAKSHGCLRAWVDINNKNLPGYQRVGFLKNNQKYKAYVRFSNNDHLPMRKDGERDLRGMAFKVFDVNYGKQILKASQGDSTIDFLMYGHPRFFIKDNEDYIGFIEGIRDGSGKKRLLWEQTSAAISTVRAQKAIFDRTNPLSIEYFSATPVRLGSLEQSNRSAMKYGVTPCHDYSQSDGQDKNNPNYMRDNLLKALEVHKEVCFKFKIQPQTYPEVMPIEDATVLWPSERGSALSGIAGREKYQPYLEVGTITIKHSDNSDVEKNYDMTEICEDMSMSPWRTISEHKPLGRTMRMRRDLYLGTSNYRRTANKVEQKEPSPWQ